MCPLSITVFVFYFCLVLKAAVEMFLVTQEQSRTTSQSVSQTCGGFAADLSRGFSQSSSPGKCQNMSGRDWK